MLLTSLFKKSCIAFIVMLLLAFINSTKAQNLTRASLAVSPGSMFFIAVQDETPPKQELTIIISDVAATTETVVRAPDFYQLFTTQDGQAAKTFIIAGNGTFKIFIGFSGNNIAGDVTGEITVENDETPTAVVHLKTTVVPRPTPSVNPAKLTGFITTEGTLSASKFFNLSISGIPVQGDQTIVVKAPQGYLVSQANIPSTFVGATVLTAKNGVINTKIFVTISNTTDTGKVKGNVIVTGTQINTANVFVSGKVTPKPLPAITTDKDSLVGFSTTIFKTSAVQSYQLTAVNLAAGLNAVVKAPTGYEIALSVGGIFSGQLTILQNAGSINNTIFVRLKSQSTTGTITGVIQNSAGSITKNVSLSGKVNPLPTFTVSPSAITGFSAIQTQPSAVKTYTITANNLVATDVAVVTAPVNYEVREEGKTVFSSSVTLAQTSTATINSIVEVRIKANAVLGNVSGIIQNAVGSFTRTVSVSGFVAAPFLSASPSTLSFMAVKNQASGAKSYIVIASNITPGKTVNVIASSAYEISLNSSGPFSGTLTLPQNVTNGVNTTVFVRLKPSAITGTVTGTVQQSVGGLSKTVNLSATVSGTFASANTINNAVTDNGIYVKAYPNPFTDYFITEIKAQAGKHVLLKLTDLNGNVLMQKEIIASGNSQQINMQVKEKITGVFLMEATVGNDKEIVRLLKQ
jgi:hypothetical protein